MILVTVGTQFFDELVAEVDRLAAAGAFAAPVFAQIGLNRTLPRHIEYVAFDRNLLERMRTADLVISHAGTGTIIELIELGVPFIAVVNGGKAGDHQREFLRALSETHDVCWVNSPGDLAAALPRARPARARMPDGCLRLADDISNYLAPAAAVPIAQAAMSG